jgi:hypothetical protein
LPLLAAPSGYLLHQGLRRAASGAEFNSILARTGAFLLGYGFLLALGVVFS